MKSLVLALSLAVAAAGFAPLAADAKRIGGGSSAGMQRSLPARTPAPVSPAAPAQAVPRAPATPAAVPPTPPRRSWMAPLAGLAAGLGIAALMSHLGIGAAMGNILTMLLLAAVAFFAIRFLMNRFGRRQPALATPNGADPGMFRQADPLPGASAYTPPSAPVAAAVALPPGFDAPAFERIAKMIFIRMQAANDKGDLNDLRAFTTPEMFAAIKLDLQDRRDAPQTTDVVRIDAEVLDVATEASRQIVSVRFHGLVREVSDTGATPFDEVWHLVKPADGSQEWAIAGIQQTAVA